MYCHGFYEFFLTKLNFPAKHCRGVRLPLRTAGANWMDDHFSSVCRMPPTSHLSCGTLVNSRNKHSGLDRKETSNLKSFPLQYNLESNLSCPRKIAAGVAIWRTPQNQLIVIRPGCKLQMNPQRRHYKRRWTQRRPYAREQTRHKMHRAPKPLSIAAFPFVSGAFLRRPLSLPLPSSWCV